MNIEQRSIEDWIRLTRENDNEVLKIPISLHTTSGSMTPFIRVNEDTVSVVPCTIHDISIGDIVLVRSNRQPAGFVLHRVYYIKNGTIKTIGDNMTTPDEETNASKLLGRVVSVTGPGKNIDCFSCQRRVQGRLIAATHGIRRILLPVRRRMRKLFSVIK